MKPENHNCEISETSFYCHTRMLTSIIAIFHTIRYHSIPIFVVKDILHLIQKRFSLGDFFITVAKFPQKLKCYGRQNAENRMNANAFGSKVFVSLKAHVAPLA